MMKRYDFVDRTIYLIRKELEQNLPDEDTLDEMIKKAKEIIYKLYD